MKLGLCELCSSSSVSLSSVNSRRFSSPHLHDAGPYRRSRAGAVEEDYLLWHLQNFCLSIPGDSDRGCSAFQPFIKVLCV